MTTSINSVVTVFQNVFTNHGSTLLNGILIATTIGGQSLVRKLTFSCPCAYPLNIYHSLVFMFGPTAALLLIGITINSTTWKLAHGFFFRVRDTRHSWKTTCASWIEVLLQSSIAPIAWLFVVFLDGGYYRCYRSHEFCLTADAILCKNETVWNSYATSTSFNRISDNGKYCPPCICFPNPTDASYLEAESQIYAWALLVVTGVGAFLVITCHRMCDKYTLVQRQYVETYKNVEIQKFDAAAKEHASQLAEHNARAFFGQKDWTKRDWDWVSGIPEINNPLFARLRIITAQEAQKTVYTPLQLWNEDKGNRIPQPDLQLTQIVVDETKED